MTQDIEINAETLSKLLLASKRPESRDAVVVPNAAAVIRTARSLVQALHSNDQNDTSVIENLAQALRVLRNTCAGGPAAAEHLLSLQLVDLIAAVLDAITAGLAGLNWTLPAVAAQLLANAASGGPSCAAACWRSLFPARLLTLSHVESLQSEDATSLALLTMTRSVECAAEDLVGPRGAPILAALLHANHRNAEKGRNNDTLGLLLTYLALHKGLLGKLFKGLSSIGKEGRLENAQSDQGRTPDSGVAQQMTAAHAYLLQELCAETHHAPTTAESLINYRVEGRGDGSMAFLVQLIESLAASSAQPLDTLHQQVLQDAMHLIREVCGRDDHGAALSGGVTLVAWLQAAGMVPLLLSMLKALGPIENPRRSVAPGPEQPLADLAPALREKAAAYASTAPYVGYRSDILSGERG